MEHTVAVLFTGVRGRGILRTSHCWRSPNFAGKEFCELRLNGVLGSWAAEACRQTHGGRVLESPPNYGYHPTNFRKNSNRLWFLRLLPYAPSRRSYPDGHRGGHKCCSRTRAP